MAGNYVQVCIVEITVALTRYNEPAWLIKDTLKSLADQTEVRAQILFLDQYIEDDGFKPYCAQLSNDRIRFEHITIPARSLSFARNAAIERSKTEILLFIDSDAIAEPSWASQLSATLSRPGVGIAGGRIVPLWHRKPLWLARARIVQDQYSILDLGGEERPFNRVVGASFGLNLKRLRSLATFDQNLGRRKGQLFSGEESELCQRTRDAGIKILYNGKAVVKHQVLPERITYRWILRRMYFAGIARALLGGGPNPSGQLNAWDYAAMFVVLPFYIAGYASAQLRSTAPPG